MTCPTEAGAGRWLSIGLWEKTFAIDPLPRQLFSALGKSDPRTSLQASVAGVSPGDGSYSLAAPVITFTLSGG